MSDGEMVRHSGDLCLLEIGLDLLVGPRAHVRGPSSIRFLTGFFCEGVHGGNC